MAKEFETKKRKASIPETGAGSSKTKKVKSQDIPGKKRKAIDEAESPKVKKSRVESKSIVTKVDHSAKAKPVKKASAIGNVKANGSNTALKTKKAEPTQSNEAAEVDEDEKDGEEDEKIDDQTETLLKGWESDGDEKDGEDKDWTAGQSIPGIGKKQKKKLQQALKAGASDKPGVVYIGRIPHGFYEHEMREYFKQFGNILKLRLSRNRKTGASKHFAFIQFESATVADIVAKTMDNYLLFGHILKIKTVPDEQVHEDLFKGANKRFKKVPWSAIEGRKLKQGASEAVWEKRVEKEQNRRNQKAEKLKTIGYEFDSPKIKSAKGVAKPTEPQSEVEVKAIEATSAEESTKPTKIIESVSKVTEVIPDAKISEKPKKAKKLKDVTVTETLHTDPVSQLVENGKEVHKTKDGEGSEVKEEKKKHKSKKGKTA